MNGFMKYTSKCSFHKEEAIIIRNPARIDQFTAELNRIWKKYFPDWRYGQLMMNFLGWVSCDKKIDPFFIEENKMLTYLKEYCGEEVDDGNSN
uniref:Uncharacterized protein n=1 Tax=Siphoviridae sp. cttFh17 TaxID=2826491 RepID=A0A8S5NJA8_9CAUD|nr:MAG TPA: Protein of unknown function (DUF1040) [Siphoviridae sp. cttFh17]